MVVLIGLRFESSFVGEGGVEMDIAIAYCGVCSAEVSSNKTRGERPSELSSVRRGESDEGGDRGGRYKSSAIDFYTSKLLNIILRLISFAHLHLYTHSFVSSLTKMLQLHGNTHAIA